jgi:acetyl esterase/lipase
VDLNGKTIPLISQLIPFFIWHMGGSTMLNHHRNSSAALRASGRSVAVVSSLMFTYPSTLWHGTFLTVGGKEPATGGQLTVRRSQFDLLTACLAQHPTG